MKESVKMDEVDRKIMGLLYTNARIPISEIGRTISMTQPAVKERIQKLEDQGIISAYRAKFDRKKLNKGIMAFVLFKTSKCLEFVSFCEATEEVSELYRISGEFNYLIKVLCESMESLSAFQDSMLEIGVSNTLIVMNTHIEEKIMF